MSFRNFFGVILILGAVVLVTASRYVAELLLTSQNLIFGYAFGIVVYGAWLALSGGLPLQAQKAKGKKCTTNTAHMGHNYLGPQTRCPECLKQQHRQDMIV